MTETPEILQDENGKWVRRDIFTKEIAVKEGCDTEDVESVLDEMLETGPFNIQTVGGSEYIQLTSLPAGLGYAAKIKASMAKDRLTRFFKGY